MNEERVKVFRSHRKRQRFVKTEPSPVPVACSTTVLGVACFDIRVLWGWELRPRAQSKTLLWHFGCAVCHINIFLSQWCKMIFW